MAARGQFKKLASCFFYPLRRILILCNGHQTSQKNISAAPIYLNICSKMKPMSYRLLIFIDRDGRVAWHS